MTLYNTFYIRKRIVPNCFLLVFIIIITSVVGGSLFFFRFLYARRLTRTANVDDDGC